MTDTDTDDQPAAVRCSLCKRHYSRTENLLTGKTVWIRPRQKRQPVRCDHPPDAVEYLGDDGWADPTWKDQGT